MDKEFSFFFYVKRGLELPGNNKWGPYRLYRLLDCDTFQMGQIS